MWSWMSSPCAATISSRWRRSRESRSSGFGEQIRIYDGDTLIFHGSDESTYTVCETAEELEAAFAAAITAEDGR